LPSIRGNTGGCRDSRFKLRGRMGAVLQGNIASCMYVATEFSLVLTCIATQAAMINLNGRRERGDDAFERSWAVEIYPWRRSLRRSATSNPTVPPQKEGPQIAAPYRAVRAFTVPRQKFESRSRFSRVTLSNLLPLLFLTHDASPTTQ